MRTLVLSILLSFAAAGYLGAQDHGHDHSTHGHDERQAEVDTAAHHEGEAHTDGHGACACHEDHGDEEFNASESAFHHIADANAFHLFGDVYLPLPCIAYAPEHGLSFFMSSKFKAHHHGNGTVAIDKYVLVHGELKRIHGDFPYGEVAVECYTHQAKEGTEEEVTVVVKDGQCYELESKSTLDGGVFGGGLTSWYDFSITKNVFTMLLVFTLLLLVFRGVAKAYEKRRGLAPAGLQGFFEPIVLFLRDEVARPFIGEKYDKYLPFLLSLFFFILGLNLVGQVPFFPGSANVTGNLGVTLVLALFTFFVVNLSGKRDYWQHVFWMPGVPGWVKIILTPVEVLGLFIKPFTLMLRLFANITAGHIVILSFVGLIFIFGEAGKNAGGAGIGIAASVPLTIFMMAIELLVAFIQAFVFTLLTASYIGAAIEEHHHAEDHHH